MRPHGEVRQALWDAALTLHEQRDGATWRDLAEHAKVGYKAACRTSENMERAGLLVEVGREKRAHSRRWMKLYAPVLNVPVVPSGVELVRVQNVEDPFPRWLAVAA
jgi:hypothetical protein